MTKVINLRKRKIMKTKPIMRKERKNINFNKIYNEKYKFLLLLMSITGILFGTICYRFINNSQLTQAITESFSILNSNDFKSVFMYLIKLDLIYFLISFFCCLSID